MIRGINNSNDVWSPAVVVGRYCTSRGVYIQMSWRQLPQQSCVLTAFGWWILSLDWGFRLALTTTSKQRRQQCLAKARGTHGLR